MYKGRAMPAVLSLPEIADHRVLTALKSCMFHSSVSSMFALTSSRLLLESVLYRGSVGHPQGVLQGGRLCEGLAPED